MDPNVLRLAMGAAGPTGPDNFLYSWGAEDNGQLGRGVVSQCSSPIQVGSDKDWSYIDSSALGRSVFSIKNNGTLYAWGVNGYGQLGSSSTLTSLTPRYIDAGPWSTVSAGQDFTVAIRTNGSMWSWGRNSNYGQLGLGNTTNYSSQKQIGALTTWSKVACGANHSLAIKTDGTLWAWGSNYNGQLGIGTSGSGTEKSSPVQVGALTTWSKIATGAFCSFGITTDGKLWAWGSAANGRLGTGNTTYRSSPTQIGALTTWSNVFSGNAHCLAIKTDGTLWSWGLNNLGQLGDGSLTSRSSPVQVGALTNWSFISCGYRFTLALKTDNTLWAWGSNNNGELGLGDTSFRTSPVQVGSLTNWSAIATSGNASFGITQ